MCRYAAMRDTATPVHAKLRVLRFISGCYTVPKVIAALLLCLVLAACSESSGTTEVDIVIDVDRTYQRMSGWEVTARTWEYDKRGDRFDPSWEQLADPIFTELVNVAGINRIRLALKSGFENPHDFWADFQAGRIGYAAYKTRFYEKINDNQDPALTNKKGYQFSALDYVVETMLMPMRKKLQARGERLIVNLCYQDFRHSDLTSQLDHAENPEEYAEFVVAAFDHLKQKYNIVPDYFEAILEPDNTRSWTGERIGKALLAAQQRLQAAGYHPSLIAPSTSRLVLANQYFDEMIAEPGVADILDVYAYHRYATQGLPVWGERLVLNGIRGRAQAYGLRSSMLEYLHGNIDDLLDDLTIANVSAWQIWGIASRAEQPADQDSVMLLVSRPEESSPARVSLTQNASLVAPIFRAVREGAVRVDAHSSTSSVRVVAFDHSASGSSVLMYIRKAISGTLSVRGLPPGEYRVELAQRGGVMRQLGVVVAEAGTPLRLAVEGAGLMSVLAGPGDTVPDALGGPGAF